MVSALDRKLIRDLAQLKGQVLTIALVIACGIASFVTLRSAYDSLLFSRDAYYEHQAFADVFGHLERAPNDLAAHVGTIPGVAVSETRIVERVTLPMPDMQEPAGATIVSLPRDGKPRLNGVYLSTGRLPHSGRLDEVVVLQGFAEAHALEPGATIPAIINGTRRELSVVGIALSPEFIFVLAPGELTYDPKRTAVIWMSEEAVSAAFDLQGAFNDVAVALQPGTSATAVLSALDALLERYGGAGAVARAKQASHYMLSGELAQLEQLATTLPLIFLGVAAFLVNVVLSRLIHLERSTIATLKAVGYTDWTVGLHYLKLVLCIGVLGAALGVSSGAWLGNELFELYTGRFFRFPEPIYRLAPSSVVVCITISLGAAAIGSLLSVRSVTRLSPAAAMQPPAPARYHRTLLRTRGLFAHLGPSLKMVIREVERKPVRTALSSIGIALAVGLLVTSRFMYDSVDSLVYSVFERSMREDLAVTFQKPLPERAVREAAHLPGVIRAEGLRVVPVRFASGHVFRDSVLYAYPDDGDLRRLLDAGETPVALPIEGIVVTRTLADILRVAPGEAISLKIREGERPTLELTVTGVVDELFGLQGHVRAGVLARALGEEPAVNMALLSIDPAFRGDVQARLNDTPWVASISSPDDLRTQFEEQTGSTMLVMTLVLTLFASIIAIGVVYNNARVALSSRSRDLASLRVLGMTRGEIASILFGEMAVQVALAIPLGLVLGRTMSRGIMSMVDPETYRFPVVISSKTYAFAVVVTVASALLSGLFVRRRLDALDLIAVLKTRE